MNTDIPECRIADHARLATKSEKKNPRTNSTFTAGISFPVTCDMDDTIFYKTIN